MDKVPRDAQSRHELAMRLKRLLVEFEEAQTPAERDRVWEQVEHLLDEALAERDAPQQSEE